MSFSYDFTVVMPIFNARKTIKRAVESITNQSLNSITYEILLLNDGSTDQSERVCLEYSDLYANIRYFFHENKGVAATRNFGLDQAKGKYILFLDADDELKPGTLISVFKTFEANHEAADLLVIPLYNYDGVNLTPHVRNRPFFNEKNKAVFNISEYPYLNQVTINVAVKNMPKERRIYFNEKLKQSEDALFNTTMILRKKNILFAKEGGYIYNRNRFSAVDRYKNPADIKGTLLYFFETLINVAKEQNNQYVPAYVQSMILYEINWRFKESHLFPYHLPRGEFAKWQNRLKEVFKCIDVKTILRYPYMDFYHKAYFIQEYKGDLSYSINTFGLYFYSQKELICTLKRITLVFNKIKRKIDCLHFVGYVKAPWLKMFKDVSLFVGEKDSSAQKVDLNDSPAGYYKAREKVANFYGFDFEIPLTSSATINFDVKIDHTSIKTVGYLENEVIFKTYLRLYDVVYDDFLIRYEDSPCKIIIIKTKEAQGLATKIKKRYAKKLSQKNQNNIVKFNQIRELASPLFKHKSIWLYNDRAGILDNAYKQFIHDIKKKDGASRYYVIHEEDLDNPQFPKRNCVMYGSLRHKLLFFYSTYILTSFKDTKEYNPLSNRAFNALYSDLKFDLIYLQHGVLYAHTPWLYGKHKAKFDKFLISSSFEKKNLIKNYGYLEKDLLLSGMPRFDAIYPAPAKKKKILFAPSWRKSLFHEDKELNFTLNEDALYNSPFYKGISDLINSAELNALLGKYSYTLDVKMHPIFLKEKPIFRTELSNIYILDSANDCDLTEYSLFITDFSSFFFDFIKLGTKITFFFPDYEHFLGGNHIYKKLDLDINLIGECHTKVSSLIDYMKKHIQTNFAVEEKFARVYKNFYYHESAFSNCESLYKNLRNHLSALG